MLKTVGRLYTWTNSHVRGRIDRAVVNPSWMTHGHICKSHTSLIMSFFCVTIEEIKGKHARPFRFLNHLSHHKDFMDIAQSACTGHLHGEGMEQVKANESCYETVK